MDEQEIDTRVGGAKKQHHTAILLTLIFIVATLLAGGAYVYLRPSHAGQSVRDVFGQPTDQRISIPIYFPQNLPDGYVYNDDSNVLKANIFYFSVTSPKKQVFNITQQPIPASFDFGTFNKKFLTPDTFNADSGAVTAGAVGSNLIASIKTNKNTWIIINSSATNSLTQLETIARSLEPAH